MTDDRMDRAERIRNMREGNRGTDDDQDDSESDDASAASQSETEPTDDSSESESPVDDSSGKEPAAGNSDASESAAGDSSESEPAADDTTGFSPLSTESETTTTDSAASGVDQSADAPDTMSGAERAADAAETAASAVETAETSAASTSDTPDDAQAVAERAAASAAEVMGTETDAVTDGSTDDQAAAGVETPAVPTDASGAGTVPGDVTGVELPDQQLLEEAMATSSVKSTEGGARAAMEGESTQSEEVVRVLEFSLGDEYYCLDIEYVEEIVKRDAVTRVPNTPDFVDGVVDLRGQITTILEPKEMMDIESEGDQNLIIVFDPKQFEEQGAIGWVVDEVRQVVPVPESEVNTPPVDAAYINGVVDREEYDQFVIWVEPEDALAQATASKEE